MERFLYRLSISPYSDTFVLKGALLFTAWDLLRHRATLDIDMLAKTKNSVENLVTLVQEICETPPILDDGILFLKSSVVGRETQIHAEYSGVQIKFIAQLENAIIPMKTDIGFGDVIFPQPSLLSYPTLLDLPPPQIKGYPPETVVAEKFQTMVSRGITNSRMKDFYDLWNLQKQMEFDGEALFKAIQKTFLNRETKLNRTSIENIMKLSQNPEKERQWNQFIKKLELNKAPPLFSHVVQSIYSFLSPLINPSQEPFALPQKWIPSKDWQL